MNILFALSLLVIAVILVPELPQEKGDQQAVTDYAKTGAYFNYNGHAIFYTLRNPEKTKTITFLHGFPTSSFDYEHLFKDLSEYRLLAIDFLGFGLSDKPRDYTYSLHEQATIVEQVWSYLNISSSHILCHDYAVSVVQELLARKSPVLESITFLNGGLFPKLHRPILVQTLLENKYVGPIVARFLFYPLFKSSMDKIFGKKKLTEQQYLELWAFVCNKQGNTLYHRLIHYMQDRRDHADRWANALKESKVPMLFINGPADPVSGIHLANELKQQKFDVKVLADDIGHYPQIEDVENVLSYFKSFLKDK